MSPRANRRGQRTDLLRPDRVRTIERPFGWLPCRLLTDGLLEKLSRPANLLHLLLALAADRRGLSFYGDRRILRTLSLTPDELDQARAELLHRDLLAFDGQTYQLLSLPARIPMPDRPPPAAQPQPTTACNPPTSIAPAETPQIPEQARNQLRHLLGRDVF